MATGRHEINAKPGTGVANFPSRAQVSATQTVETVPAGTMTYKVVAAALTGDIDIPVHRAMQVVDVWAVAVGGNGAASDTITVKNSADAITNALDMNVVDTTVVRMGTLNDANSIIDAGGTLRVTGASAVTADVFISVAFITE